MKTLEMVSLADVRNEAASKQWWPDLYLKKGRKLIQIQPDQCGAVMEVFKNGRGFSEMPKCSIDLYDIKASKIGHISHNGRVWMEDVEGNIEIPTNGCKTVAERELEGWR
jgi:hypothetical protein